MFKKKEFMSDFVFTLMQIGDAAKEQMNTFVTKYRLHQCSIFDSYHSSLS